MNALQNRLELFEIKVKAGGVSAFPALEGFLSGNDLMLDDGIAAQPHITQTTVPQLFPSDA